MSHYDRASQLPDGIAVATLVTTSNQCARDDCDSWKTIGVDIIGTDEDSDDAALVRLSICLKHLPDFIDHQILKAPGKILDTEDYDDDDEDCGDPDCPIHGDYDDYEDDEDEDDEDE